MSQQPALLRVRNRQLCSTMISSFFPSEAPKGLKQYTARGTLDKKKAYTLLSPRARHGGGIQKSKENSKKSPVRFFWLAHICTTMVRDSRGCGRRSTSSRRIIGRTTDRPHMQTAILRRLERRRDSGRYSLDSHRKKGYL